VLLISFVGNYLRLDPIHALSFVNDYSRTNSEALKKLNRQASKVKFSEKRYYTDRF